MSWETLDVQALLAAREAAHESTTSANVGSYTVPLGGMLRRQSPGSPPAGLGHCGDPGGEACPLDHAMWSTLYGK